MEGVGPAHGSIRRMDRDGDGISPIHNYSAGIYTAAGGFPHSCRVDGLDRRVSLCGPFYHIRECTQILGLRVSNGPEPDLPVAVFEARQLLAGVQAQEDFDGLRMCPLVFEPGTIDLHHEICST